MKGRVCTRKWDFNIKMMKRSEMGVTTVEKKNTESNNYDKLIYKEEGVWTFFYVWTQESLRKRELI